MPFKNITVYHKTAKYLFTLLYNREASVVQTIWQIWCWKTEKNNNNGGCYEVSCLGAGSVFEDLWGNINRKRYLVIWRFCHFFSFFVDLCYPIFYYLSIEIFFRPLMYFYIHLSYGSFLAWIVTIDLLFTYEYQLIRSWYGFVLL